MQRLCFNYVFHFLTTISLLMRFLITFSVSKIVGNVSYQINLAKYRISPNVAGLRRTSTDIFADVASVFQTSLDIFQMSPDVLGTSTRCRRMLPGFAGCRKMSLDVNQLIVKSVGCVSYQINLVK